MIHQSRAKGRPDGTGSCCPFPAHPPAAPPSLDCRASPQKQTQQIFREKTPPPQVECVYSRDPTPEPDIIEKIIIKKCPQRIIENITQKPKKPPPKIVIRVHYEPAAPPIVRNSCMQVEPRLFRASSYGYLPNCYQATIQGIQPSTSGTYLYQQSSSGTCLYQPNQYVYENTHCYNQNVCYPYNYQGYYCYRT